MSYHYLPMYKATLPPFLVLEGCNDISPELSPQPAPITSQTQQPLRGEVTHPLSSPTAELRNGHMEEERKVWLGRGTATNPNPHCNPPLYSNHHKLSSRGLSGTTFPKDRNNTEPQGQWHTSGTRRLQGGLKCWQELTYQSPERLNSPTANIAWFLTRETKAQRSGSFPSSHTVCDLWSSDE